MHSITFVWHQAAWVGRDLAKHGRGVSGVDKERNGNRKGERERKRERQRKTIEEVKETNGVLN